MKLLAISGTLIGSKTLAIVKSMVEKIQKLDPDLEIELLDLKQYNIQFCDGRDPSAYISDTKKVIDIVSEADCYLIGTPVIQGSIPGALKNVFDLVPPTALRNKVMGFIATGGTYQHYLVVENQLKPIAGYFRAFVAPSYVYAHRDHFNLQNEVVDPDVLGRMEILAKEMVLMQKGLMNYSKQISI